MTQEQNWKPYLGSKLIKSVKLVVGGDYIERWRCNKCYAVKDIPGDPNGTICGEIYDVFSYDKFRQLYGDMTDEEINAEINKKIEQGIDYEDIYSRKDLYDKTECSSTEYTFRTADGYVLDRYDTVTEAFWNEFSPKSSETYSNTLGPIRPRQSE